ncbi:rhodanese-like domain-containing protein [bacterium]|nr:rhodanese-like domain-containing protein [bacterium]
MTIIDIRDRSDNTDIHIPSAHYIPLFELQSRLEDIQELIHPNSILAVYDVSQDRMLTALSILKSHFLSIHSVLVDTVLFDKITKNTDTI